MVENEECLLRQECPLWVKSRHVQRTSQCPLSANSGHSVSWLCLRRNDKIFAQRTPNQISERKMVSTDMPVEITTAGDTVLKYTLYC